MIPNNESTILIASATTASEEYAPVYENLTNLGYNVALYNTDAVMQANELFDLRIGQGGAVTISHQGIDISPRNIAAGWIRKVNDFAAPGEYTDKSKLLLLQDEVDMFNQTIWTLYGEELWLNSPDSMLLASRKMAQLLIARSLGFNIPDTSITSSWERLSSRMFDEEKHEQFIIKMIRGVLVENNVDKAMSTTILDAITVEKLRSFASPFPGIFQPSIDKAKEWRVTTVGDKSFPVAIYTSSSAKDDWRKHQSTDSVEFKKEELDDAITAKCSQFLKKMNLKFGAFDIIESENGEFTFLECNANGQYYWFEEKFGYKISDAITEEIVKIAETATKYPS